ncbi:sensor histidine kinase [Methanothermobacter tenebrarum]|nr:histidine kinase dimerization/phosphoacceptor domain -containing protein [Methanothermobacter tenebrarum]NPV64877.1 PAS domain S-box protein [Methanobacteriaceae archaeon]
MAVLYKSQKSKKGRIWFTVFLYKVMPLVFDFYDKKVGIILLAFFTGVSIGLIYYFHFILHVHVIFTHFFYIPIILATIWFKRRSLILTGILSFLLLASSYLVSSFYLIEDLFRVLMLFFVNIVVIFLVEEIDKRRRQIAESEERYRLLFELSPQYILISNFDGKIYDVNEHVSEFIGLEKDELKGKSVFDLNLILPEKIDEAKDLLKTIKRGGKVPPYETKILDPLGNERHVRILSEPINVNGKDLVIFVVQDLTDIKEAQKELEKAIEEKDLLLKEIHHRVKNNLMIISSLLSLQARYLKGKEAFEIFKESENRARSMALIHEKLYRSSNFKEIDMMEYLQTLARGIFTSYAPTGVELNLDIDRIKMDVELAIPVGLIVNELITNSCKHAFPEGGKGEVNLKLKSLDDKILLEVSDNGVGFPEDLDWQNTESLGLQLVKSLADQINAEVQMISDNGTTFRLTIPEVSMGKG